MKTTKPFFSNKGLNPDKFLQVEKGNARSNVKVLANAFNHFFVISTSDLDIRGCDTWGTFVEFKGNAQFVQK